MRRTAIVLALFLTPGLVPHTSAQPFVDVAGVAGLDTSHSHGDICLKPEIGTGSAWADYDGDGAIDLYLTDLGGPNRLYHNDGDNDEDGIPEFTDMSVALGVQLPDHGSTGTVFADYDNDGDQDLLVLGWEGNYLFRNGLIETGTAVFADVTDIAGIADEGRPITAAWGDFDVDGYLDLYITKHLVCKDQIPNKVDDVLFHSNGDGTFTDVTEWLCGGPTDTCGQIKSLGFSPGWLDFDNDGDLDLYVVNDNIGRKYWPEGYWPNVMWRNDGPGDNGSWIFTDVSEETGTDANLNGMGLGIGDIDNDGRFDLAFSNIGPNALLWNTGDGTYINISGPAGVRRRFTPTGHEAVTWATAFFDADNDTLLDLFIAGGSIGQSPNPQPNAFFVNNGDLTFTDYSETSGLEDPKRGRAASLADFDVDGYVDIMLSNYNSPGLLYHNETGALGGTNHWLRVVAEGSVNNRDGIGTCITIINDNGQRQMREISSGATHGGGDEKVAHFGLGQKSTVDVAVRWPNNAARLYRDVAADQTLTVVDKGFVLADPVPGMAGEDNTFAISGAPASAQIVLLASPLPGIRQMPGCGPVTLGLIEPLVLATGVSDAEGNLSIIAFAPEGAEGSVGYFQAVAIDGCRASGRLRFVFG